VVSKVVTGVLKRGNSFSNFDSPFPGFESTCGAGQMLLRSFETAVLSFETAVLSFETVVLSFERQLHT
jgi:hypothetical protein